MWWWNFGIPALIGGAYLWKGLSTKYRRLRLWRDALALYKDTMSDLQISSLWSWRARITFRSIPLAVRITGVAGSKDKVAVVIEGAEGFSILKLRRQLLKLWTQEIEIGDETFDDLFLVEGPLRSVSALLDAQLRSQLFRASADCDDLEIGDGRLRAELSEEELPRVLSVLLNIGRKLSEPMDVDRQIAQNARRDHEAGVRLFNLLLLARERPGDPETLETLRGACSDASPAVRLRAALELGEEGRDILLQLVGSSEDEPALLQALQSEDGDLRVAAALALGRVGSAGAVLPLQEAAEGPWRDHELHQATRQAIAEIQSRLQGAAPGQLSLGATEAGQLSLAQAETGQLSLAQAEAPLLPHAVAEPEQPSHGARETPAVRPV